MDAISPDLAAAGLGLLGGFVLGIAARYGKFCTLAAIEDVLFGGNTHRWRMWVTAMAAAILLAQALAHIGLIDPAKSFYVARPFNLVSTVVGGVMFGIGMALVGTCAFGTIVRLGGGDLKSFVVFLVTGIAAYMAAAGPMALIHRALLEPLAVPRAFLADPRLDHLLHRLTGLPPILFAALIVAALLFWVASDRAFARRLRAWVWGILVGSLIAFGWLATGWIASDPFEPISLVSFSFVKPLGASVMYLMTSAGTQIGFGIGSVLGVLLGSAVSAIRLGHWRWEAADDANEARRQIIGAFLMGTGGMYALGCTIGQGLSAISLLTLSAPIALASIWFGAWLGLTYLMSGSVRDCLRSLVEGRR